MLGGAGARGSKLQDDTRVRSSTYIAGGFASLITSLAFGLMALLGIAAQLGVMAAWRRGDIEGPQSIFLFLFSFLLAAIGLWFFYARFVTVPAREQRLARILELHPDEPWLLNEAWAQRKVVDHGSLAVAVFLWIWSAGWLGFCALIWSVNHDKIIAAFHQSWSEAALGVTLVLCGVLGVWCATRSTLHWWRFGASTLRIDTLPGYLGDRFRGSIVVRLPDHTPLEAEIACERVTVLWVRTAKGGRRKEMSTEPLWSKCWPLERDRMTRMKDGTVIIPIDVELPNNKPPFEVDENGAGIRWVLNLRTDFERVPKQMGAATDALNPAGISAEFVIPVYART